MFSPFVIVVHESLSCPQCENMGHFWNGFKYAEDAKKTKKVQKLEDFSEEQQAVELLRTNKGLMNNYFKI